MSENSNLPQVITMQSVMTTLSTRISALPADKQALFNAEFARRMKEWQTRILQAFPNADFTVIGWAIDMPRTVDIGVYVYSMPADANPRFYVEVSVPMASRGRGRMQAGKLIIYDETDEAHSLYHQVMYWLKGRVGRA